MARTKMTYHNRLLNGQCGICGRPSDLKPDGTFYAACQRCRDRVKNEYQRKAKGQSDFSQRQTLCWKCQHALPNYKKGTGCLWSRKLKPVEGWTAIPKGNSFLVIDCPMFLQDEERQKDAEGNT